MVMSSWPQWSPAGLLGVVVVAVVMVVVVVLVVVVMVVYVVVVRITVSGSILADFGIRLIVWRANHFSAVLLLTSVNKQYHINSSTALALENPKGQLAHL